MLPRKTSRRKCKKHEKEWRGFCVDQNLEETWLARLNVLEAFDLISICEGHYPGRSGSGGTPPHVKLRLKERLLPNVASHWEEHKMTILGEVNQLFGTGGTYISLELKFKLRSGTARLIYQEALTVRIHGRHPRTGQEMDAETRDWFTQTVSQAESLDRLVIALWDQADSDPE